MTSADSSAEGHRLAEAPGGSAYTQMSVKPRSATCSSAIAVKWSTRPCQGSGLASAAAELWDNGHFDGVQSGAIPRVEPDVLAERYWEMVRDRDLHEVLAA